jgi:hypothetical protein
MSTSYYLAFTDEAQATSVLYTTTTTPAVIDNDGKEISPEVITITPNYANIDVLGILYERPPEPMPLDYVPVALEGYHVNVLVLNNENSVPLAPYVVVPKTPRRIWAE